MKNGSKCMFHWIKGLNGNTGVYITPEGAMPEDDFNKLTKKLNENTKAFGFDTSIEVFLIPERLFNLISKPEESYCINSVKLTRTIYVRGEGYSLHDIIDIYKKVSDKTKKIHYIPEIIYFTKESYNYFSDITNSKDKKLDIFHRMKIVVEEKILETLDL